MESEAEDTPRTELESDKGPIRKGPTYGTTGDRTVKDASPAENLFAAITIHDDGIGPSSQPPPSRKLKTTTKDPIHTAFLFDDNQHEIFKNVGESVDKIRKALGRTQTDHEMKEDDILTIVQTSN